MVRSWAGSISSTPSGTVTVKEKVALSLGWSLAGKKVAAPLGSETTHASSPSVCQPSSNSDVASAIVCGVPP